MKRVPPVVSAILALIALLAGIPSAAAVPPIATPRAANVSTPGQAIKGSYIVTLKSGIEPRGLARALSVSPRYVYTEALLGFAAQLSLGQLKVLERRPEVESIEEDQVVITEAHIAAKAPIALATQEVPTGGGLYGLDRIDQRTLPLTGSFPTRVTAAGVSVYVLDSGIATAHAAFGGRATNVYDALGGDGQDCNGHGTHVAGTIGGATHGVAKDVLLRGVRVLDCYGRGSTSATIAGVDWVRGNGTTPSVANMSLSGGFSKALNRAVENLVGSGVAVAVAAGNSGTDACRASPASAKGAVTVAASDRTDARWPFSNTGVCIDIYAPGADITSTWLGGGTLTMSGTSMASPHVAGTIALYKASGDKSSLTVSNWITSTATTGVIGANHADTPNRLLYTGGL